MASFQGSFVVRTLATQRIREVLADISEEHVQGWLKEQPAGKINAEAIELFIENSIQNGYPRVERPGDAAQPVWKSAQEVAAGLDLAAEVQEHWAAELRGDTVTLLPTPVVASENYNLHAMHTLLVRYPWVPKNIVRSAFFKAISFQKAVERLESIDIGDKQLKKKRCENKMPPPPVEVPLALAKEIAFPGDAIETHLSLLREYRQERLSELRQNGGLCTCSCCFDDEVLPEEAILCDGETTHNFCRSCVKSLAQNTFGSGLFAQNFQEACRASFSGSSGSSSSSCSALASSSSSSSAGPGLDLSMVVLCCPDTSGCNGHFSDRDLALCLPPKDYKRYNSRSAALQALKAGLSDLVPCPSCEFIVEMSDLSEEVVRCLSPDCGKVTCRWCGEPDHRPLRCDQIEKNGEVKLRTFMEEHMTEAVARRCPNSHCRKAYERSEGCNKMHCPCGTTFCYLCGEVLNNTRPYDHFADGHVGGGHSSKESRCTVYGTPAWAKQTVAAAKDRAEKALQEYLEAHPELQNLGGERIRSIKRSVGFHDEPTPVRKRHRAVPNVANPNPQQPRRSLFQCSIQ